MTDKQTLAQSLRRYGSDFISHPVSRGIEDIEAAGELMLEAARALAEQPAEQEAALPVGIVKSISGPNYENGLTAVFVHTDMNSTLKTGDPLYTTPQPAKLEPGNWVVYNFCAEVASGLSFAEALEYLTPERLARQWCAVCVVDQSNLPASPQPAKREPLTNADLKRVINAATMPSNPDDVGRWVVNVCRAVERAHGIGGGV